MAVPQPPVGHYQGNSLTHPMLIIAFYIFNPKVTGESCSEVGSPKPGWVSSGVWTRNLPILIQCLNPLGHSPQFMCSSKYSLLLIFMQSNFICNVTFISLESGSKILFVWSCFLYSFAFDSIVGTVPPSPLLKKVNGQFFLKIMISIPPNTGWIERAYSYLELNCAKRRDKMSISTMVNLLFLSVLKWPVRLWERNQEDTLWTLGFFFI